MFNARLALLTLLAVAVLGPAIYGWHHVQLQRTAAAFLERADQLEAEQKWVASADYLHRYLSLFPGDDAVRIRMTKTFDRGAKDWPQRVRAIDLYYQTLGLISSEEEKPVLRRRLTEMLLEQTCIATPKLKPKPQNCWKPTAKTQVPGGSLPSLFMDRCSPARQSAGPRAARRVHQVFESALQSNPGDIQLSAILAEFYRGKERLLDEKKRECLAPSGRKRPIS